MATPTTVISSPSAAAAPTSAPSPAPTPSSTLVPTPAPSSSTPATGSQVSQRVSSVDPNKYPIREDYARALLEEKMASIGSSDPAATVAETEESTPAETDLTAAPDADTSAIETDSAVEVEAPAEGDVEQPVESDEFDFELEPEAPVTPEVLSQMIQENGVR